MAHELRIAPAAERAIIKLATGLRAAVLDAIALLALDPRPAGCRKIRGLPARFEVYRVEVGRTDRIIYQTKDQSMLVLVVKVADREDVYERVSELRRSLE